MPKRKPVQPDDGLRIAHDTRQRINLILTMLCDMYDVTPEDLCSRSHVRHIVEPRQIAMLLIKHVDYSISYETIGRMFDRTYGATRMSCQCAYNLIELDSTIREKIQPILTELQIRIAHA